MWSQISKHTTALRGIAFRQTINLKQQPQLSSVFKKNGWKNQFYTDMYMCVLKERNLGLPMLACELALNPFYIIWSQKQLCTEASYVITVRFQPLRSPCHLAMSNPLQDLPIPHILDRPPTYRTTINQGRSMGKLKAHAWIRGQMDEKKFKDRR